MIVILVIVLFTIVGFAAFFSKSKEVTNYAEWKSACKMGVNSADAVSRTLNREVNINCPTYNINSQANDKDKIMADAAQYMYDCWDIFKRGNVNILSWDNGQNDYCVVCQNIVFDKKEKIHVSDFVKYLENTNTNKEMTYAEYLTGKKTMGYAQVAAENYIDTSEAYDVVFTYTRYVDYKNPKTMAVANMLPSPGTALAVSFAASFTPIATPVQTTMLAATTSGIILKTFFSGKNAEWVSGIYLVPTKAKDLKMIGCDEFPLKQYTRQDGG